MPRKFRLVVVGSVIAIAAIAYQLTMSSVNEFHFADARKGEMLGGATTDCPECGRMAEHLHIKEFYCHSCKAQFTAAKHARIRFIRGEDGDFFRE